MRRGDGTNYLAIEPLSGFEQVGKGEGGLEAELRSQSQGLATYEAEFDHLAELSGHLAEKVVQQREAEPA
jgi:hypothetical protein